MGDFIDVMRNSLQDTKTFTVGIIENMTYQRYLFLIKADIAISAQQWLYKIISWNIKSKSFTIYLTKKYNILQRITDLENAIEIINKKIGAIEEEIKNINKNNQLVSKKYIIMVRK